MSCIQTAQALNPNNPTCHYAMAMVCLFQKRPDAAQMEQSARAAIRLSPRDPRVFLYHFLAGVGEWANNDFRTTNGVLQSHREACNYQNTDWFVYFGAALACAHTGDPDSAQTYLNKALARNPGLTIEAYRTAFPYPAWPEWFEQLRPDLELLVGLGLPCE